MPKPSVLYLTDLYYAARDRVYCEEDLWVTRRLRSSFEILIAHPLDAQRFESLVDLIVFRNTGPVIYYQSEFDAFRGRALAQGLPVYNALTGKADTLGKQYLVDLTVAGLPVIPTFDFDNDAADSSSLPHANRYVVKPKHGADSIAMRQLSADELAQERTGVHASRTESAISSTSSNVTGDALIVQPFVDFEYEVSFYFVDGEFQYALHAPEKTARWVLTPFTPSATDLEFAQSFIDWNQQSHGIERVDACRLANGDLLLVELEDLNPYLSLDCLDKPSREQFVASFANALRRLV